MESSKSEPRQYYQVSDLVKVYPGDVQELSGIDFTVGRGEFLGSLGPRR